MAPFIIFSYKLFKCILMVCENNRLCQLCTKWYTMHFGALSLYKCVFLGFFIQFKTSFKIISLIETSQSIDGAKREYPRKTT